MTGFGIDVQFEVFVVVGPEDEAIEHFVVCLSAVRDRAVGIGVIRR